MKAKQIREERGKKTYALLVDTGDEVTTELRALLKSTTCPPPASQRSGLGRCEVELFRRGEEKVRKNPGGGTEGGCAPPGRHEDSVEGGADGWFEEDEGGRKKKRPAKTVIGRAGPVLGRVPTLLRR